MPEEVCVLIHGFGGLPEELKPLADALADNGYEVVLPPLWRDGESGGQSRREPGQATVTSWITKIVPAVEAALQKGRRVHLIGFSLGALLSSLIAEQYKVASVVMLAPILYYAGSNPLFQQIALAIKANWPRTEAAQEVLRGRLDKLGGTPLKTARQLRRVVQMTKRVLPRMVCPLCVIHGEKDELADPRSAEYIYDAVPAAIKELHYVEGAGHMLLIDNPDTVTRLVLAFLSSLPGDSVHTHPALTS
ncbi:MAG: alpha/beta fold hydrolase [Alicyclobacillus herbarius]|uniref:alpha/beta hydrolase n=1 Tax=Alicyclobacillus herbarius TaxID=122960 RepID=UPI002353F9E7|nr:alpha/beta fold hydrolase [Alicyclobacillus herbarius]MCL6633886.1 alpha/beta fold hydrolase [Alicyclobacillus herbarius]